MENSLHTFKLRLSGPEIVGMQRMLDDEIIPYRLHEEAMAGEDGKRRVDLSVDKDDAYYFEKVYGRYIHGNERHQH